MKLNDGMDASINSPQATQQDILIGLPSTPEGDVTGKVDGRSSSESVRKETHANLFKDMNGEVGTAVSTSCPDNFMVILKNPLYIYLGSFFSSNE